MTWLTNKIGNWTRSLLAVAILATSLVLGATSAHADDTMTCEVVEIEASTTDSPSVDAALKDLAKYLKKPPFSSFNTFKKSARIARSVAKLHTENYDTPHGAVTVIVRDIDRPTKKRPRLSLGITVETESGAQYVDTKTTVDAGGFLLFGRTVSDTSGIVTAVGCR